MIPVVIGFGVIAVAAGGGVLLLPAIKEAVARSRRRRRSKSRKKRPRTPRQRIDLSAPPRADSDSAGGQEPEPGTDPPAAD